MKWFKNINMLLFLVITLNQNITLASSGANDPNIPQEAPPPYPSPGKDPPESYKSPFSIETKRRTITDVKEEALKFRNENEQLPLRSCPIKDPYCTNTK